MVKKLYKHEFLAWLRIMPLIYGITLVIAAMNRLIMCFETDNIYYNIIQVSGIIMFGIGLLVCLFAPIVFSVVRYYKNLFTGEGYLTFTLPVSTTAHLWVKSITALCFSVFSVVAILLSLCVFTAGEVFYEIWLAAVYLLQKIPADLVWHVVGWVAEFLVLLLVTVYATHLLYYACISLGQTFRKNRILSAVGVYFAYYIFTQICSTAFVILSVVVAESELVEKIGMFIFEHPEASVHIGFAISIVAYSILCGAFFLISRFVIRKRLNLE